MAFLWRGRRALVIRLPRVFPELLLVAYARTLGCNNRTLQFPSKIGILFGNFQMWKCKCRWFHFPPATCSGRALKFGCSAVHIISSQTLFFLQFTFLKSLSRSLHWDINSRVSSLLYQKPFLLSAASALAHLSLHARWWRHYSCSSGYSALGSRIAGMEIQVFRNENSSQTNAYSYYSNYSPIPDWSQTNAPLVLSFLKS